MSSTWSRCAREEIFRRLKTVVALRLHIHHRGDCCVCPKEGCAGVSRLQSYQARWPEDGDFVEYKHTIPMWLIKLLSS